MDLKKISPRLVAAVFVILAFALSLSLRIALPYDKVFSETGIKYTSSDAYYNMRQVDNLAYNYPDHTDFDPYYIYPEGHGVHPRFFVWFVSTLSWIFGAGAPTQHTIDLVGVYLPAILGALCVIPVYVIGKELANRWVGVLSAWLIAILPGEFVGRTMLGFTDYHVAEVLFTTLTMMFLVLAVKTAEQRQLVFGHIRHPDWAVIRRPLIYSLLTGFFLWLYVYTWAGALLFIFIIFIYLVIQIIINHLRNKSSDYLCIVSVPMLLLTLILSAFLSVFLNAIFYTSLVIAILIPVVMSFASRYMGGRKWKSFYYPVAVFGLGLVCLGLFYLVSPTLVRSMLSSFASFIPQGAHTTTVEMEPLINGTYGNPFLFVLGNYPGLLQSFIPIENTGPGLSFANILYFIFSTFFLAIATIVILIYLLIRKDDGSGRALIIIWSLVILVCNLLQRRFGYYFAINVSILVGWLAWMVLERVSLRLNPGGAAVKGKETAARLRARRRKDDSSIAASWLVRGVVFVLIMGIVYPGNIDQFVVTASSAQYAPSDAWQSSLNWLRENTPEPLGSSDAYYAKYDKLEPGEKFDYPEFAYGVLSWWDYGYWITRIGHRLPTGNPSQDPEVLTNLGMYFTSQDEESADELIQEMDARYVVIDYQSAYMNPITAAGKFPAIAIWAGDEMEDYLDLYLLPMEDHWEMRPLFYPAYFKSMAVRLYNFDGKAVTPESVWVISFKVTSDEDGNTYRQVTSAEQFSSYEEAESYIEEQEEPSSYRIVSPNSMNSPVPLEALDSYNLIHSSDEQTSLVDGQTIPAVKIFEYTD